MGVSVSYAGVDFAPERIMKDFDIAIVGAGPAGSATAIASARLGYRVAIVDKQFFPRDKLCGDFINPINWPVFRALGVDERIRGEAHAVVRGFRLTTHFGAHAEAAFSLQDHERLLGIGLTRSRLDQVLLEKTRHEGVSLFQGCKVINLSKRSDGWTVEIDCAGVSKTLQAQVLVGADGRNSWVAQRIGLSSSGDVTGRAVGFQVRLRSAFTDDKVAIHLFPGGYAGLVSLGDGTVNLCLTIDRARIVSERAEEMLFDEYLPQNPYLKKILLSSERLGKVRWTYPVYFPPRRSSGERVVLVGDAARVSEPVTGEGVYLAMRSGLLAASTIDQAFHSGDLSAARLKRYELNCRSEFRRRRMLNSLIYLAVYRPGIVSKLIGLFNQHERFLDTLVSAICAPKSIERSWLN